jgi:hypothetical protein
LGFRAIGVKTNFEGHSKARIQPHPAYAANDMPSRRLEYFVNQGIEAGAAAGMLESTTLPPVASAFHFGFHWA